MNDQVKLKYALGECEQAPLVKPGIVAAIGAVLKRWSQDYRSRRELLTLSDTMLKDIGISRADAVREGNKAFWRD